MPISDRHISYNNGLINLKDFPRGDLIKKEGNVEFYKVPEDIEVLTVWNNEVKWLKPESYSIHKDLKMLSVKTNKGNTIEVSDEHSLVTLDENLDFKRSNPDVGMVVPRLKDYYSKYVKPKNLKYEICYDYTRFNLNFDFGYLLGVIIGDGWVNHPNKETGRNPRPNSIMLATIWDDMANKITSVLRSYGYNGSMYTITNDHVFDNKTYTHSKRTWDFKPLANFLRDHIGRGAKNKKLPEFWSQTSENFRWGLLSGLIDTDGTICICKNKVNIAFDTSSERLAYEFIALGNTLGLTLAMSIAKRKHGTIEHIIRFNSSSILRMKDKLLINNENKKNALDQIDINAVVRITDFTPTISKDRILELRNYLIGYRDTVNINRCNYVLDRYNKIYGGSFLKEYITDIISLYPDFFKDGFWNKYRKMVLDDNIEWEMITKIEEIPEITEAYDITIKPYPTFVLHNGIVVYDTASFIPTYTKEAKEEIDTVIGSKSFYLTPDGDITYSIKSDPLTYVLGHLSR